jgi:hypothetical protein
LPSSALMSVTFAIDANTLPAAVTTLNTKMGVLCPGMPFEIRELDCAPTGTNVIGPPWRFHFTVVFTLTFP